MHNDYGFRREKYVDVDVCFTPDGKTLVIKVSPFTATHWTSSDLEDEHDSVK